MSSSAAAISSLTIVPTVIERLGAQTVAYAALDVTTARISAPRCRAASPSARRCRCSTGIRIADCHLFDEDGIAFERRVELTDIDMELLDTFV